MRDVYKMNQNPSRCKLREHRIDDVTSWGTPLYQPNEAVHVRGGDWVGWMVSGIGGCEPAVEEQQIFSLKTIYVNS